MNKKTIFFIGIGLAVCFIVLLFLSGIVRITHNSEEMEWCNSQIMCNGTSKGAKVVYDEYLKNYELICYCEGGVKELVLLSSNDMFLT